jgi:hypothetical protein
VSTDTPMSAIKRSSWIAGFVAASGLNLLSVSGIADAVVQWRCFLDMDSIVATYHQLRGLLFSWLPFHIPNFLQHYTLLTGSFGIMLNGYSLVTTGTPYSIGYGPKTKPAKYLFAVLFYIVPWIFLIWTAYVLHEQSKLLSRYLGIDENEEMGAVFQKQAQRVSADRRTYLVTVILYPLACLSFLFLFSDFAYKVFKTSEIAGIPFVRSCSGL